MAGPHVAVASKTLSRTSQSFFKDPLLFLRLVWQFAPVAFEAIMAGIDPTGSEV